MKKLFHILCIGLVLTFATSCTITESIFFNEDMSGEYILGYDLSEAKNVTKDMNDEEDVSEKAIKKKQDTSIVFNELFEKFKDSIAGLPEEEQQNLKKLRDMTLRIQEDEAEGVFKFSISKKFKSVSDLEDINEQVDEAMNVAMTFDDKGNSTSSTSEFKEASENSKAIYTYKDNVFCRLQPTTKKANNENEGEETNEMGEQIDQGFSEMTDGSFYIITYSFPKKIISISNKNAQISKDGKSFTLSIPWNEMEKDESQLNLNIVLED